MKTAFLLFLALGSAWAVYWVILRPSIHRNLKRKHYNLLREIEMAGINKDPGWNSRAFAELLSDVRAGSGYLNFSILPVFLAKVKGEISDVDMEREREIFRNAPDWIREARDRHALLVVAGVLSNSPAWWPPIMAVFLSCFFSDKVLYFIEEMRETSIGVSIRRTA